ncbi:MAG: MiaB/RimO family radical SAM methylthiotransferase [Phycisphaeraceae bacterium]|nr:MiaB/RimO family radical SAM methylthiotransferase [Phycisphaeraceae bacterium]
MPETRSVYLETFGCQMNVLDSQLVRGQLQALGYRFTDDWKRADVVLYNTCSVREHAESKVYSRIGLVGKHKRRRPDQVLGVIGCMAERDGEDMLRRYPQVDLLCGPGELDKVPMLIDNVLRTRLGEPIRVPGQATATAAPPGDATGAGNRAVQPARVALQGNTHRRSSTLAAAEDQLEMLDLARAFSPDDNERSAYVRITRGCNKFCTYCVVPRTRGREIHRPPAHIIDECKRLVEAGVVEITLLGQTVNHYHFDEASAVMLNGVVQPQIGATVGAAGPRLEPGREVTRFSDLLERIHDQVPELARLRFVTSFPRDFGDDILDVIARCPRICRYLHLPAQSGSNRMLKAMNRGYTVEEYLDLVDRIRAKLPDATIAGDLICGFCGETEEDHQATIRLLERARYKNCFIFKYSPRPGTAAHERMPDDVPDAVKRRRNQELLETQSRISREIHEAQVGRVHRVFVESISARERRSANRADPSVTLNWAAPRDVLQLCGRTAGDLIVMFEAEESLVGSIVDVKIQRAAPLALFGERVGRPATVAG